MIEIIGDIWVQKCDWLCVTTNGVIKADGKAVMGKGIALQTAQRYPNISTILAQKLKDRGNIVSPLLFANGKWIISFPTKLDWRMPSDINLIKQSAIQLKEAFDKQIKKPIIMLPRPGCSNGGLKWEDVKEVIEPILIDDRIILIDNHV